MEGGVVREQIDARLRELARRAGLGGIPAAVLWAAAIAFGAAVAWGLWHWWPTEPVRAIGSDDASGPGILARGASSGARAGSVEPTRAGDVARGEASATVCVHVVGAVRHPGLYRIAGGARIADAVEAAGGVTADAAPEGVNLARLVSDGEQIALPTRDELKHGGVSGAAAGGGSVGAAASGAGERVNINTADAAALDKLPGIGPSTAAKIVADRTANGPFATLDDLGRVPGIGPKKLDQLKSAICVN